MPRRGRSRSRRGCGRNKPQEVGTSNVVPTIIFAVSFLLAFLLAVGVIWISYGPH